MKKRGIFLQRIWVSFLGLIYIRKKVCCGEEDFFYCLRGEEKKTGDSLVLEGFWENNDSRKPKDYYQDCPGTLLVTLGVLTHMRFLHLVVSECSILLIGVDVTGHKLFC